MIKKIKQMINIEFLEKQQLEGKSIQLFKKKDKDKDTKENQNNNKNKKIQDIDFYEIFPNFFKRKNKKQK